MPGRFRDLSVVSNGPDTAEPWGFTIAIACLGEAVSSNKEITEKHHFPDTGEIYGVGDARTDQDARTSLNTCGWGLELQRAEPPCAVMMSVSIGLGYASTVAAQKLLTGGFDPYAR